MRCAAVLLALLLTACLATPPIPVPPAPPEPPAPVPGVSRAVFEGITVGDPVAALSGLPQQDGETTFPDGTSAFTWRLDERRPTGGWIWWEVHVKDGFVVLSADF